jgi:hypothetical protein
MREQLHRSRSAVVSLLGITSMKASSEEGAFRAHPFIIAGANLFFCIYLEQRLRYDVDNHYLGLFVFLEASAWALLMISYFARSLTLVLVRTSIFPLTPVSRYAFAYLAGLRRPVMVGLWLTNVLFLAVFYRCTLLGAVLIIAIHSFMLLVISALTTTLQFIFLRLSRPASGAGVLVAFGFIVLLAGTYLFHAASLPGVVPIVAQTTSALAGIQSGDLQSAGWNFGVLVAVLCAAFLVGKRYA